MAGPNRRLVKAGFGLGGAAILGIVPFTLLGTGDSHTNSDGPAEAFVSTVVEGKTREARSWVDLTLASPGTKESATVDFYFTNLDPDETNETFTIVLPSDLYEHFYDCKGQDMVDPDSYLQENLPKLHQENIQRHRDNILSRTKLSVNKEVPQVSSSTDNPKQYRKIVASANADLQEKIYLTTKEDGEKEPSKKLYLKEIAHIQCSIKSDALWQTIESRRKIIIPAVYLGINGSVMPSKIMRNVEVPSGSPLIYQAGFREPLSGNDNEMVWWDEKPSDNNKKMEISGSEAIFLDINLSDKREKDILMAGVLLGLSASLFVTFLSLCFDISWDRIFRRRQR